LELGDFGVFLLWCPKVTILLLFFMFWLMIMAGRSWFERFWLGEFVVWGRTECSARRQIEQCACS
jgi:hypothetical protein